VAVDVNGRAGLSELKLHLSDEDRLLLSMVCGLYYDLREVWSTYVDSVMYLEVRSRAMEYAIVYRVALSDDAGRDERSRKYGIRACSFVHGEAGRASIIYDEAVCPLDLD
jgi:hypothetical protein